MKSILKRFFTLAAMSFALHAQSPNADTVIDTMIGVYGGEKNLNRLNHYEQTWHIETKTSDTNGTDKRTVHLPFYLKTELIYPHKTEIRTLDRDQGTKQFANHIMPVQGPMLDAMRGQLMRLFHPGVLKEKSGHITLTPTPEHYCLTWQSGTVTAEYYVSVKSYLIEKVVGRLQIGPQQMEFVTLYEDYKPVQGVMLPHTEIKYAGSVNTAVMRLKEMTFTADPVTLKNIK